MHQLKKNKMENKNITVSSNHNCINHRKRLATIGLRRNTLRNGTMHLMTGTHHMQKIIFRLAENLLREWKPKMAASGLILMAFTTK
jgi:hypothetical protein